MSMSERRRTMVDKVVRRYGLEATESFGFCQVAEDMANPNDYVERLFFLLMGTEV